MSTLRERIEGLRPLIVKATTTHVMHLNDPDHPNYQKADYCRLCWELSKAKDELLAALAAALVAEGQARESAATQIADDILLRIAKRYANCEVNVYPHCPELTPVEAVLRCAKEEGFHLTNSAAAPSLHKEGLPAIEKLIRLIEASRDGFLDGKPYILTYSDIINELEQIGGTDDRLRQFADKLEAAIRARDFTDDWTPLSVQQSCSEMVHEVLEDEMHVPAALHKEGAGGAPQVSVPMREWLKAQRVTLSEHQLWAVESYLVMNVMPIADALPLQRTLPDEQFKGAVVEAMGADGERRTIQEVLRLHVDSSESMYETFKRVGDIQGMDVQSGVTAGLKRAIEVADKLAAASPAGRAEQVAKEKKSDENCI